MIILSIIKLIIILCIVATVHEFGHFLIAKLFKIGVREFSIGFGPKIIQKKYKETKYSLRWLPFGGYVEIEGQGEESDKENSYSKKNAFQKIAVLLAGAVFNVILAIAILMIISFCVPTFSTEITEFSQDSVLLQTGIQTGDTITKINDKKVKLGQDLLDAKYADQSTTKIEYIHDGEIKEITITDAVKEIGYIGIAFKLDGDVATNEIDTVRGGKAADKAGMKSKDRIVSVNDIETKTASEAIHIIKQHANKEIDVVVIRNDSETVNLKLIPDVQKQFDLGINDTKQIATTFDLAFSKSIKIVTTVIGSYADLFKGKVMIEDVSSIVGIGVVVSKTTGILEYLNMLAIISLAIGIANLLPIQPLDGGKILFVIIEFITRKKIPINVENMISLIGFAALILLTIVAMFNDIVKIF